MEDQQVSGAAGDEKAEAQHDSGNDDDRAGTDAVGQRAPDEAGNAHDDEADGHCAGNPGPRPAGLVGHRLQIDRQGEHRPHCQTGNQRPGADDHPAISIFHFPAPQAFAP
ncbi:hypothetical protein D3C87_1877280 [compost metagenome]